MDNYDAPSGDATRIGRYELVGLLATGGMAEVYLAMSGELSGFRTLAVVKRVLPHLSSNREFIKMFFDEARIAAQLDHPNVARIIEVGQDGDEYFLAMEVVQGRPLSALLRRANKHEQPLTHAQAAFVVAQAGKGLAYAHNLTDGDGRPLSVVHRDVSPQNILVSFEGAVKVIDFGVARALGRVTETVPGGLKGKIQYMSPEQASGEQVDRRSDVFSLGVVLWEALCGRRLFRRDGDLETLRAIIQEPIVPPSKLVRISPRLERIVMQALERDPEDRFQDAEEMALELERHAFTTAGFSPAQIATAMKTLFASDLARWRRTAAAAMDLGSSPADWGDTSGTFLRAVPKELRSRGSTVALHRVVNLQETGPLTGPTREHRSDSKSAQSDFTLPDLPPRPQRGWFIGGAIALMVTVTLGMLALMRPPPIVTTMIRSASNGIFSVPVPTAAPRLETVAPVPASEAAPSGQAAPPSPLPALTGKPKEDPLLAAWSGVEAHPRPPVRSSVRPTPAARPANKIVDKTVDKIGDKPAQWPALVDPWARSPSPAAAVGGEAKVCSVRFGTQPWAEVWLDGKNTGGHTPYSGTIPCGTHQVTFKRRDLGWVRTYTITARAGESFRQSFSLGPGSGP